MKNAILVSNTTFDGNVGDAFEANGYPAFKKHS